MQQQTLIGTPGYCYGEQVTVIGVPVPGKLEVAYDRGRDQDDWQAPKVGIEDEEDVELVQFAHLSDFCATGLEPAYSPYGYMIAADGTIYSLTEKWRHGTVLAMMNPELARQQGYRQPDRESSAFHYQQFELDNYRQLDTVRIAFGMMVAVSVSKGYKPATQKQIQATAACLKQAGLSMQDEVNCDYGDMTVRRALHVLEEDHTPPPARELTPPEDFQ